MINNSDDESTNYVEHRPKTLMLLTFLSCSTFIWVYYSTPYCGNLFSYLYFSFFIATPHFTLTSNCLRFS